ncbi:MAG TPA: 50S ribosomal protein L6 [Syntrophales bacterium]|nr:50S ribosomal protein L6 [Syntrophales bacterium]HOX95044.1 50S ribosomal protein L6 [Syntrophales bacterium]HPI57324.1 50S ribosomal protein L6 [Syntrophales bacterium]HPN25204.1 50S ribosomal protein L6 [Syntrophales bacterium]HQM29377.1 50S ribosomal protein L6 [Syntrophales bacterium]
MSRIGKKPISIPANVKVQRKNADIVVEGPKGSLTMRLPGEIDVTQEAGAVVLKKLVDNRRGRSLYGMTRTLIHNMVTGVSTGFQKNLEISGVGYRAEMSGSDLLKLYLGYSTPLEYRLPKGITVKIEKQVNVTLTGIDKELIGRVAAEIRSLKKPEPYKGKGVKYAGERVRRKVGKSAGA